MIKRLPKNCAKIVLIVSLFLTAASAQEIIVPQEVMIGSKIVAEIPNAPRGNILWDYPDTLESEEIGAKVYFWGIAGTYKINAVIIPLKLITVEGKSFDVVDGPVKRVNATFKIIGSVPPAPVPPPEPSPTTVPFETPGLTVIIFREAGEGGSLPVGQRNIFVSSKILKWCTENCVKIAGQPAFRIWDDDYTPERFGNVDPILKSAYFKILPQAQNNLPWIVISDGKKGYSGPLPKDIDTTLTLLQGFKQ